MHRRVLYIAFKIPAVLLLLFLVQGCANASLSEADASLRRGEYFQAAQTYRKVYNKLKKPNERSIRGEVAAKLAFTEAKLGRNARAIAAYRNAIRYGQSDSLYLPLGQNLHAEGKYREAIDAYDTYIRSYPDDAIAQSSRLGAINVMGGNNTTRYKISQARFANSRRSEYAPFLSKDGSQLFLTTTAETVTGDSRSNVTGMKHGDIWMAKTNEHGIWQTPEPVGGMVNTDADEGTASISPDGKTMYFSRAVSQEGTDERIIIFVSERLEAEWGEPYPVELLNDTLYNYVHPSVSPDGRFLYFASDRHGGEGDFDIWRIRIDRKDAKPENLGTQINTKGREVFPYIRNDSLLYFASSGHPGLGGLDIFKARVIGPTLWEVENMGLPVNSSADDFGITFYPDKEAGFFSSSRGDARGYDNIYSFELPDLNIRIQGSVTDLEEEPLPNATIRIVGRDGSNRMTRTRNDGTFDFPLERGVEYTMLAGAKGFMNVSQDFEAEDTEEDAVYEITFMLASMTEPNIVENIFYDYDKASLRPESKTALDELVKVLEDNPAISIQLSAHTDRVGSDAYNISLSERRAKSVVDYLIDAGISSERLTWKGYGKSMPKKVTKKITREYSDFEEGVLLDEDFIDTLPQELQDIADQINRRTEFIVTGINNW